MAYKDPAVGRARGRERFRRRVAERCAKGLCPGCGKAPAQPDRRLCASCGDKRRAAERTRYARATAAGKPYGGREVEAKRRNGRERSKKRRRERLAAGLCTRCGKHPGGGNRTVCAPCREARRSAERALYAARRAAGLCGRCGNPAFNGASRCGPCSAVAAEYNPIRNKAGRKRYGVSGGSGPP